MILCADGLTGIKESISVAFPNTEYQRCIVHQVRNTLNHQSNWGGSFIQKSTLTTVKMPISILLFLWQHYVLFSSCCFH